MVQQDGPLDGEMERSVLTDRIWPETKRGCPITRLCKREALQPEILALHLCGACHDRHSVLTSTSLLMNHTDNTGHAISQPMTAYSLGVGACQRLSTHLKALSCFRWYLRSETAVTLGQTRSDWGERKREESIGKVFFHANTTTWIQSREKEKKEERKKTNYFFFLITDFSYIYTVYMCVCVCVCVCVFILRNLAGVQTHMFI